MSPMQDVSIDGPPCKLEPLQGFSREGRVTTKQVKAEVLVYKPLCTPCPELHTVEGSSPSRRASCIWAIKEIFKCLVPWFHATQPGETLADLFASGVDQPLGQLQYFRPLSPSF